MTSSSDTSAPAGANASTWARGTFLREYATRRLRPVEVMVLVRYRDDLGGRLLELGCGAGRLTSYLIDMAEEVHGIDLSPAMIAHCRATLPRGVFHEGDFGDLSRFEAGSFTAVLAPCNVLDVFDDADRRAVLDALHRLLAPGGLLVMSSHNRGHVPKLRTPGQLRRDHPVKLAADLVRLPRRMRNRRRLVHLERQGPGYQIINDSAHGYSLLHYYISRDDQQRQLADHGFELLECLDPDGRLVEAGATAPDIVELHYVARRAGA
jgi:SAM-dependent methyltransferase